MLCMNFHQISFAKLKYPIKMMIPFLSLLFQLLPDEVQLPLLLLLQVHLIQNMIQNILLSVSP